MPAEFGQIAQKYVNFRVEFETMLVENTRQEELLPQSKTAPKIKAKLKDLKKERYKQLAKFDQLQSIEEVELIDESHDIGF